MFNRMTNLFWERAYRILFATRTGFYFVMMQPLMVAA
jgi:hypothetical protein